MLLGTSPSSVACLEQPNAESPGWDTVLISLVQDLLAIMDLNAPNENSLSERDVEHQQQSTNACPTFKIRVRTMSGNCLLLDVSITHTLCDLKLKIAARLGARSSDLGIVFRGRLLGDDDSERRVIDFGLGAGCVIAVVRQVRYVRVVALVNYIDTVFTPWCRAEYGTLDVRLDVPRNIPCAALIKAEVRRRFDGGRYDCVQNMTNPHLFLLLYELHWDTVFTETRISFGDEDCLDDFADALAYPIEVYVVDQTHCECGTCDLGWMLDGWHCPQIWTSPAERVSPSRYSPRSSPSRYSLDSEVEDEARDSDGEPAPKKRKSTAAGASQPAAGAPSGQTASGANQPVARNCLTYLDQFS